MASSRINQDLNHDQSRLLIQINHGFKPDQSRLQPAQSRLLIQINHGFKPDQSRLQPAQS
jgi:hypothetical protein